ncbi:MAG TPA: class I SAM-dependent methyltransferase, partial [Tepidisphaeraceae bacterium]|nr:class I SAM-dependent methyltransferase [Tepidisphaeraceae bacterium]
MAFSKLNNLRTWRFRSPSRTGHMEINRLLEFEKWVTLSRSFYLDRFGLELDPMQVDLSSTPELALIQTIQTANKGNPQVFLSTGLRTAMDYIREIESAGLSLPACERILEFGVGFGRLLRHFLPFQAKLVGCDIVPEVVEWTKKSLGSRTEIVHTAPAPPLPFEGGTFDVVYANSVFTHIQNDETPKWIEEFRRITRPGGV